MELLLQAKAEVHGRQPVPFFLSTTDPTCPGLGSNFSLRGDSQATDTWSETASVLIAELAWPLFVAVMRSIDCWYGLCF
jgi:hypothetical protein